MKKWNAPAIAEVKVSETASGYWCGDWEGDPRCCLQYFLSCHDDSKAGNTDSGDGDKSDNKDVVNFNS